LILISTATTTEASLLHGIKRVVGKTIFIVTYPAAATADYVVRSTVISICYCRGDMMFAAMVAEERIWDLWR
jgi:hypothetical protein